MQFLFADHVLDPDRRELRRGPKLIDVEPQVLDLLIYLVQNHPTLSADAAAAVAGNTSQAKLMTALPRFVRRTYQALEG